MMKENFVHRCWWKHTKTWDDALSSKGTPGKEEAGEGDKEEDHPQAALAANRQFQSVPWESSKRTH